MCTGAIQCVTYFSNLFSKPKKVQIFWIHFKPSKVKNQTIIVKNAAMCLGTILCVPEQELIWPILLLQSPGTVHNLYDLWWVLKNFWKIGVLVAFQPKQSWSNIIIYSMYLHYKKTQTVIGKKRSNVHWCNSMYSRFLQKIAGFFKKIL